MRWYVLYWRAARLVSPIALLGLRTWTRLSGQERARMMVRNEYGEILLVRGVIGGGAWSLPGGGIERGESAVAAAARELLEETGIQIDAATIADCGVIEGGGLPYRAHIVRGQTSRQVLPERLHNPREIRDAAWFTSEELPEPLEQVSRVALAREIARNA